MKKNYFLSVAFLLVLVTGFAQAPVISPITGPSNFCFNTVNPPSFTTSATNSPTNYSWGVIPGGSVQINPTGFGMVSISFPNVNKTYTVFCTATNSSGNSQPVFYVVNVFQGPTITFSGNNNFCQGSSTNLSASPTLLQGSSTLYYTWSPGTGLNTTFGPNVTANPSVPTSYTVTAFNGPCTTTTSIFVSPLSLPLVTATSGTICQGDLVQLTASGANTYMWNTGALTDTIWVSPGVTTTYTVTGTDNNGCSSSYNSVMEVDACTGIVRHSGDGPAAEIYPNPSTGILTIQTGNLYNGEEVILQVIDLTGRIVVTEKIVQSRSVHDLARLPDGMYTVVLRQGSTLTTLKLVKQ